MDSHSPLRLILEVDPGSDPIGGHLEGPDGHVEFVGWLGLASALEQLLSGPAQADARAPTD